MASILVPDSLSSGQMACVTSSGPRRYAMKLRVPSEAVWHSDGWMAYAYILVVFSSSSSGEPFIEGNVSIILKCWFPHNIIQFHIIVCDRCYMTYIQSNLYNSNNI